MAQRAPMSQSVYIRHPNHCSTALPCGHKQGSSVTTGTGADLVRPDLLLDPLGAGDGARGSRLRLCRGVRPILCREAAGCGNAETRRWAGRRRRPHMLSRLHKISTRTCDEADNRLGETGHGRSQRTRAEMTRRRRAFLTEQAMRTDICVLEQT